MSREVHTVRHVSASGDLTQGWQLKIEPDGPRVIATIRLGSAQHEIDELVCLPPRVRHCARVIMRISEEDWTLAPVVVLREGSSVRMQLRPLCDALGARGLLLTCAPPEVASILEAL